MHLFQSVKKEEAVKDERHYGYVHNVQDGELAEKLHVLSPRGGGLGPYDRVRQRHRSAGLFDVVNSDH